MTDDFYDLLEVPPDASQDEIKDAYREQVRVYHPDLNDDDRARAQFTAIKTAYDILGDPVERQAYDRLGHEEYVAKRTSGLPSPDVWQSDDEDDSSDTELSYSESERASASASTASSAAAGSAASGSATAGRSSSATGSSGSASTAGASATSTGTASGAAGTGSATGSAGRSGSRTSASSAGTASGTGRSRTRSGSDTDAGNPLARWWRRQNFSLPLLWLSMLVYAAGLGHFGLANADALGSLSARLRAVGADPAGAWTLLSGGRHGLETAVGFVRGVELVAPPLEPTLWYGALAGVVVLALGVLLAVRVATREEAGGPVTIDETIAVSVAVTAAATLAGGPLLAGAVLMPLLFGVVVRHTRRGPGWNPSYLYVCPVLGPLAGFGAGAVGVASLPVDLAAFVLLPVVGGLALPLRATIKKHLGR